jgi:hypothetical protein
MRKIITVLLLALLIIPAQGSSTSEKEFIASTASPSDTTIYEVGEALFLAAAGSWLANKQIPRILGTQVEFNAPLFTKVLASLFFAVGITGGITGAFMLAHFIHMKSTKSDSANNPISYRTKQSS